MSKSSPAFQFYPQDFLVGTGDMLAEEVGGYIRLLCYQWAKGELPNNRKKLMQMSGVFDNDSLSVILKKFKMTESGNLANERLENTRSEQQEYRDKQREKALKRWSKNREDNDDAAAHATALPMDMPEACPSPSPSTSSLSSTSTSKESLGEKTPKPPSKIFKPPSVDEVSEYCTERKNIVDPEKFISYYTSNGWMVGKTKMKNWKAAVHTWEKNNFNSKNNEQLREITRELRDSDPRL